MGNDNENGAEGPWTPKEFFFERFVQSVFSPALSYVCWVGSGWNEGRVTARTTETCVPNGRDLVRDPPSPPGQSKEGLPKSWSPLYNK